MTQIANAYAQGLYQLAKDEDLSQIILQQLMTLQSAFAEEPSFCRLLSTANLSKEERVSILDSSFRGKVHPYVLNFLKILTERGYIAHFSDCCVAFKNQYNEDNDILPVSAVTAVPMTEQQQAKLKEKLTSLTGKTVDLANRVDPQCLGGVRLDYDGKRVDGTVKNHMDGLAALLRG